MKKAAAFLIVLGLLAAIGYFVGIERNRYALLSASGEIRAGSKFGVHVGQELDKARDALIAEGFREALTPRDLGDMGYSKPDKFYFLDTSWRSGTVWLVVQGNSVDAIGWNYQLGAP